MVKLKKIVASLAVCVLAVAWPLSAGAQNYDTSSSTRVFFQTLCPTNADTGAPVSWGNCINNIYNLLLRLSGILAIIMVIFAGYLYMVAGGDGEKISHARHLVSRVVQGIVILALAYLFLKVLDPSFIEIRDITDPFR